MRFFLKDEEVQLVIAPQVSFTQNETPDTFSCVLAANSIESPYEPMSSFVIEWDNGEKSIFYVVLDNVVVFSANPKRYTHKLTLVQNIQELEKHIIRATRFVQPPNREKTTYRAGTWRWVEHTNHFHSYIVELSDSASIPNFWSESIIINKKEQIESLQYRFNILTVRNTVDKSSTHNIEDNNILQNEIDTPLSRIFSSVGVSINIADKAEIDDFPADLTKNIGEWIDVPTNIQDIVKSYQGEKLIVSGNISSPNVNASGGLLLNDINHIIVHLEVRIKTYYYSAYDVLDILSKQYAKNRRYATFEKPYNMPDRDSELGQLLTSTIVPNMFFSQSTLFQAVMQVFQLFDAVFTLDENKVLGIEYLNDNSKTKLSDVQFSGIQRDFKEGTYNNKFICNYQNALQDITHPKTSYAIANSNSLGVPQESDHLIKLPQPIETLDKIELLMSGTFTISGVITEIGTDIRTTNVEVVDFPLDITYFIKDSTSWSLLDKATTYPTNYDYVVNSITYTLKSYMYLTQASALFYSKGSNEINLATKYNNNIQQTLYILGNVVAGAIYRLTGRGFEAGNYTLIPAIPNANTTTIDWSTIFTKTQYKGNTSGILSIEGGDNKYNGEYLTNQQGNNVDIAKLGANILGLQYRSGVPTLVITHKITSISQAIKKGQIWNRDDGKWVANVCSYTIYNNEIVGTVEFSKNYNALALSTQINNQKRFSNIANELTTPCKEWINEYCYISSNDIGASDTIALGSGNIMPFIAKTFGGNYTNKIDFAVFSTTDAWGAKYIPLRTYHSGNNLCFEMEYSSPISAGYLLTKENGQYFNETINYADEDGFFDFCDIVFFEKGSEFGSRFPIIDLGSHTVRGSIFDFEYYKKPNEIFGLSYSLSFISYDNEIFIGQKFLEQNGFYNDRNKNNLYIVETDYDLSIFDNKILNAASRTAITSITLTNNYVKFNTAEQLELRNWAIIDDEGNVYLASNNSADTSSFGLYFTTKIKRL